MNRCILAVACLSLLVSAGCGKPEEKLAKHVESLGKIMEDNVSSPKDGVEKIRSYLRANLGDMLEAAGDFAADLDKIDDPAARATRAKEGVALLKTAVQAAMEPGQKFMAAAMENEEATKAVKEIVESWEKTGDALKESDLLEGLPMM